MTEQAELIEKFYQSFQKKDAIGMADCYADDVVFSDPVFPELKGKRARAMWRMLCEKAHEIEITYRDIVVEGNRGSVIWEARYPFSQTGRTVHNVIRADFEFRNGRIIRHRDDFSFYRWSRQALGPVGWLLGWTPFLLSKVRRSAAASLTRYLEKR